MSRTTRVLLAVAASLAVLGAAGCQDKARDAAANRPRVPTAGADASPLAHVLAINLPATQAGRRLTVQCPEFTVRGPIPETYASYGQDVSPPLRWSDAPYGTESIVVLVEDPDVQGTTPYVHWIVYNLPPETRGLPEGIPKLGRLKEPYGAMQGRNSRGSLGYFGPRPPEGDPPHRYHFQVFALKTRLDFLHPGVNRQAILNAMEGNVLGKGEVVGTYQRQATPGEP